jgi:lipid-A-disaccharide synthase
LSPPRILIVAGEVSGDLHGGHLLSELVRLLPGLDAFGIGGERLEAAGLELVASSQDLAHMGLAEVLRELPRIRRILSRVHAEALRRRAGAAVLIDSPDFNLRLARRLVNHGIPVFLYVSPQLWAWRRGRVRTIRRVAREVLCILPFEVDFYREHGVAARYVGHPLVDDLAAEGALARRDPGDPRRLALLPGSRTMEVRALLPTMLQALAGLSPEEVREVILVEAPGVGGAVETVLAGAPPDPRLSRVRGAARRLQLAGCGIAWTASGTATLECALLDVPMVVGYRLHPVSFALARLLVRVPHVALANLIAGRSAVPELLQGDWNHQGLGAATRKLQGGGGDAQRHALAEVRERLGGPGASRRAAEAIAEALS